MNSISEKIILGRKAKRFNQKDFAQLIGVSQPSLIKFEKGETDLIPLGVARKISSELDIPFNELFDIEPDKEKRSLLLDQIDELEKEKKKSEMLLNYFSQKYKELYIKNLERDFDSNFRYILQLKISLKEYKNEEARLKLESQIESEKYFLRHTISEIKDEGLLNVFDLLEMLYKFDPEIDRIIDRGNDIEKELTKYWNEFMEISQSMVEQFLFWHNKKLEKENKPVRP